MHERHLGLRRCRARRLGRRPRTIPAADWGLTSLCPDWTIRDVVAHLRVIARDPGRIFTSWVSHLQRACHGRSCGESPAQTLENFRAIQHVRRSIPGREVGVLGEILVHDEDIRRPLGLRRAYPHEALRLVADAFAKSTFPVGGKARVAGLALAATDDDWRHGTGHLVQGPLASLLLAIAGRPAALAELTGDGVAHLATSATPRVTS
ncbi:MAG: maleylpyruvate isomerase family mycothiol-dependent enzyme [Dermatophilaceae bacterium]